ncbi:MAG: hypothetical protein R3C19_18545 [Planctomycetaceae bacterium]
MIAPSNIVIRFPAWPICAAFTMLLTNPASLAEHPISVTEAQVFVTQTAARIRIQLFAEDLYLFDNLEADESDVLSPDQLRLGLEQHRQFLLEKVTLRDAKGELIRGQVTDVRPFEIPADGISVDDLMLHTATYELEFPFDEPPEFLTLQQDISDANFIYPSEMKLALHQSGTDMTYTDTLKPGAPVTLRFDWDQESLPEDATDEDWKKWFEQQREETLGITSYSSVYSFIYVEPAEVRHEILIPLANLKTVLPMQHSDPAFIEIAEQDAVRELIRQWLTDVNPVTINGKAVAPDFSRIDFFGLDLKDFARQAQARRVSLASGRVGIILTYPVPDDVVREVALTWDKFHSSIRKVQSVVFTYPDGLQKFEFSRFNAADENVFHWSAKADDLPQPAGAVPASIPPPPTLTVPVVSVALLPLALLLAIRAGWCRRLSVVVLVTAALCWPLGQRQIADPFRQPPPIAAGEADDVFRQLHRGTMRAMDFGTEDRIYDVLRQTVDGTLLEDIYLQLRNAMQMREQGGAVARVRDVNYLDGGIVADNNAAADWPAFRYRSTWTLSGTVEHWGHIHERENRFEAVFRIEPRNGEWKITGMQISDQQNLASRTKLRRF